MQADEIAETVQKLKTRENNRFWSVQLLALKQIYSVKKTEVSFNQIQFSATNFDPMLDGSLIICNFITSDRCHGIHWVLYSKRRPKLIV
jgi:predicted oxidoreductase